MDDLTQRTVRGGLAKLTAQAANFMLRLVFLVAMARLLSPEDFGLVGMVTIVTGLINILTHAWLSSGSVQQETIDERQLSTLFWIYVAFGVVLWLICMATAPVLAAFYHEPRLLAVTAVLGMGCLFTTAGVQHHAILQRKLRYVAIAVIEAVSLAVSTIVGVAMALGGYGYWALVAATVVLPVCNTIGLWLATRWVPGRPHFDADIGQPLRFGGLIVFNILIVYVAYNVDKVLIGWFWGAGALGIYGRAHQLATIPFENINAAIGGVAFAALSRLQGDTARFRAFFLNAYALVMTLAFPITILGALYAPEVVHVALGPQWIEAAELLRLLTPAVLVFVIINPLGWLMFAAGLVGRSTRTSFVIAPLVIAAYLVGVPFGPGGVAISLSVAMTAWLVPHVLWCVHETMISPRDLFRVAVRPFVAAAGAGAFAYIVQLQWPELSATPVLKLAVGTVIMMVTYVAILVSVFRQWQFYARLLHGLKRPAQAIVQS